MPELRQSTVEARRVAPDPGGSFSDVVEALCRVTEGMLESSDQRSARRVLPSRAGVATLLEDFRVLLFPTCFGPAGLTGHRLRYYVGARLDELRETLAREVRAGLSFRCGHPGLDARASCAACDAGALEVTDAIVASLPRLRAALDADVRAAYYDDPAARFVEETLLCYPGVAALTAHRIAHELFRLDVPLIPRMIAELSHGVTGIDIHPGAVIGSSFFIDHGTGVVIGETCTIGERVRIYQGVTLGARSFASDEGGHPLKGTSRHPLVEDDVVIYAGATILGRVKIGRGAIVGGNVWLTRDVAPGERVTQAQARRERFTGGAGI
jgi:serine O-acetyltransferase